MLNNFVLNKFYRDMGQLAKLVGMNIFFTAKKGKQLPGLKQQQ